MSLIIPSGYKSVLDYRETQLAIKLLRTYFENSLCKTLKLERVSAPMYVVGGEGLNDDLNGVERPVEFDIPDAGSTVQIVHSLAKWKRVSLKKYGFKAGEGLYTNMNAIRRDEKIDNTHSIYVDQWDWEKVISQNQRNQRYLKSVARQIVNVIIKTQSYIKNLFPLLTVDLCPDVTFITSQQLEDLYPALPPQRREYEFVKKHKTVFLMQIGGKLKSGKPHDGRAPDYDDWSLNGDILVYNELLDCAFELSSMGIRVDPAAMLYQLEQSGCQNRKALTFHKMLLSGELPLSIGGGIGQSRLCMLLLQKAHIGEVHASVWSKEMQETCARNNIKLL